MTSITSIRNLGPAMEAEFARADITTAEQVQELGADEAYARLLASGTRPHFIGYYVLVMGLQGRSWNDCQGDEKKALRVRFDALKAGNFDEGRSELEQFMARIGLVEVNKT